MKKFTHLFQLIIGVTIGCALISFASCSTPDEPENEQIQVKKNISETGKKSNAGGPVVNAGPKSYKLIFENNTSNAVYIKDIYGRQGSALPNSNNFISFKGYSSSVLIPAISGTTITYNSYASATPSTYAVPTWHMDNGVASVTDTGANILAAYGITDPNAAPSARFAYWVGTQLYVNGYTPTGGQDIGRNSLGYAASATFSGIGPTVYADWLPQSNGDIKVDIHY